ncbi:prokineticin receptor 2-like [Oculina patagonica]
MNNSTAFYHVSQTKCSFGISTTFTAVLSIECLLALAGNLLVIVSFIKTRRLKTNANYYIVNMAISDLLSVILSWPLYATEGMLQAGGSHITDPTLATYACKLGIYSRAVSYVVSIVSLVLIAVDRYIAIVFPLKAINITRRMRTFLLFLSWFVPLLGLVPYFVHSEIVKAKQQTFCRNIMSSLALKIYHFLSFALIYCVPLILILVLYPLIMKHLKRSAQLNNSPDSGRKGNMYKAKRLRQNQNIMKIFGSIVFGFFTCWTPLYIYLFLKSFYPAIFIKDKCLLLVGIFYYIFPLLSTVINPFIIIVFSSGYRAATKSLCFYFFSKCRRCSVKLNVSPAGQNIELPVLN